MLSVDMKALGFLDFSEEQVRIPHRTFRSLRDFEGGR